MKSIPIALRRLAAAAAATALLGALAGCSPSSDVSSAANGSDDPVDITLALAVQAGCPFCISIQRGAEAAAEELGANLTVISPTTPDTASQISQLNGVLASPPDVLILQPFDADALLPVVEEFAAEGVATITVDGDVSDESARISFISSDNEEGGRVAAQELAAFLDEEGPVAYFGYPPGLSSTDDRQRGFEEAIAEYDGIDYLGPQFSADDQTEVAGQVAATLQATPDLAGVFAATEAHAIGAAAALRDAGADDVAVVAFDGAPDEVVALEEGRLSMLIVQKAFEMGELAVQQAVDHVRDGVEPPSSTLTEFVVVTADNLDDPEIARYLYPAE